MVDTLPPGECGDEGLVEGPELALGEVDAPPGLRQRPAVALVRDPVQVVLLAQLAVRLVRAPAHPGGVAPVAAGARVEPPPAGRLRGLHASARDLPPDRRAGDPRLAADLRERLALAQRGFQRKALVVRQVLVPLLPDCHVGILSSLRRGGIAAPCGKDAIFRLQD